jgi:hypothetical protein
MRAFIALAVLVFVLAGCTKKEEVPVPAPAPKSLSCFQVEIVIIEGPNTVMEVIGEAPRVRMTRDGFYGHVGDKFQYCE